MSKADEAKRYQDEVERDIAGSPPPSPATVPAYRRCVEAGFLPHYFGPPWALEARCWTCLRTVAQIRQAERAYEAQHLAEAV